MGLCYTSKLPVQTESDGGAGPEVTLSEKPEKTD